MNKLVSALIVIGVAGLAEYPLEKDVSSIDGIVKAYYEVVSGPVGHQYDAERDRSLHAANAVITRISEDGGLQRHDLATEQVPLMEPFETGLFEIEIGRIVEEYDGLAHVWSTFEIRDSPDGVTVSRGVNSISLYYHDGRWWIASWATRMEGDEPLPEKYVTR